MSSTTGSFGILPMHVPSIAVLKPGLVTVYEEEKTVKYFGKEVDSKLTDHCRVLRLLLVSLQQAVDQLQSTQTVQYRS